jgi:hypothetical protein
MIEKIDYTDKMQIAMRHLIVDVLSDIQRDGLPGNHHFYITFDPRYPGVSINDWLLEKYPNEMTIIIQHWFDELKVTNEHFEIILNFGDTPEMLSIPIDSIITFADPSVEFGLKFEKNITKKLDEPNEEIDKNLVPKNSSKSQKTDSSDQKVISLDSFRK